MSTRKTTAEKIEAAKIEKQQAEARIKQLIQTQRAEERKARNHRFCKRGGYMEKLLPDLAILTDEQFETFFKRTTANDYGRKALVEITRQNAINSVILQEGMDTASGNGTTIKTPTQAEVHTEPSTITKSKKATQNTDGNGNDKPPQTAARLDNSASTVVGGHARTRG